MNRLRKFARNRRPLLSRGMIFAVILSLLANPLAAMESDPVFDDLPPDLKSIQTQIQEDPSTLFVPPSTGVISESYQGKGDKLFIHIQDAHTNLGAQKNLAAMLEDLINRYGVDLVFVEGGTGNDSLSFLRDYASPQVRRRVAMRFLEKGEISGEEYLDIVSEAPFLLWGVEDPDLYQQSLLGYAGIMRIRKDAGVYLDQIERGVDKVKIKLYPRELLKIDQAADDFRKGKTPILNYVDRLEKLAVKYAVALSDYPALNQLTRLKAQEDKIDFDKADRETEALLQGLKGNAQWDLELHDKASRVRFSELSAVSAYNRIQTEAEHAKIPTEEFPNFSRYRNYLNLVTQMDMSRVLQGLEKAEEAVFNRMAKDESTRRLLLIDRRIDLLKNYFALKLRPSEFKDYAERSDEFQTTAWVGFINRELMDKGENSFIVPHDDVLDREKSKIEDFYRSVELRDHAFIERAIEKMDQTRRNVAVLICGGYHTPNLRDLLKQNDASYVVLTPHVTEETNLQNYERVLLESIQALDRNRIEAKEGAIRPQAALERIPGILRGVLLRTGFDRSSAATTDAIIMNLASIERTRSDRLTVLDGEKPSQRWVLLGPDDDGTVQGWVLDRTKRGYTAREFTRKEFDKAWKLYLVGVRVPDSEESERWKKPRAPRIPIHYPDPFKPRLGKLAAEIRQFLDYYEYPGKGWRPHAIRLARDAQVHVDAATSLMEFIATREVQIHEAHRILSRVKETLGVQAYQGILEPIPAITYLGQTRVKENEYANPIRVANDLAWGQEAFNRYIKDLGVFIIELSRQMRDPKARLNRLANINTRYNRKIKKKQRKIREKRQSMKYASEDSVPILNREIKKLSRQMEHLEYVRKQVLDEKNTIDRLHKINHVQASLWVALTRLANILSKNEDVDKFQERMDVHLGTTDFVVYSWSEYFNFMAQWVIRFPESVTEQPFEEISSLKDDFTDVIRNPLLHMLYQGFWMDPDRLDVLSAKIPYLSQYLRSIEGWAKLYADTIGSTPWSLRTSSAKIVRVLSYFADQVTEGNKTVWRAKEELTALSPRVEDWVTELQEAYHSTHTWRKSFIYDSVQQSRHNIAYTVRQVRRIYNGIVRNREPFFEHDFIGIRGALDDLQTGHKSLGSIFDTDTGSRLKRQDEGAPDIAVPSVKTRSRADGSRVLKHITSRLLMREAVETLVYNQDFRGRSFVIEGPAQAGSGLFWVSYPKENASEISIKPIRDSDEVGGARTVAEIPIRRDDLRDPVLRDTVASSIAQTRREARDPLFEVNGPTFAEILTRRMIHPAGESEPEDFWSQYEISRESVNRLWSGLFGAETAGAASGGYQVKVIPRSILFGPDGKFRSFGHDHGFFIRKGFEEFTQNLLYLRRSALANGGGAGTHLSILVLNDRKLNQGAEAGIQEALAKAEEYSGVSFKFIDDVRVVDGDSGILQTVHDLTRKALGEERDFHLTVAFTGEQASRIDPGFAGQAEVDLLKLSDARDEAGQILSPRLVGLGLFYHEIRARNLPVPSVITQYLYTGPDGILILRPVPVDIERYLEEHQHFLEAQSSV